MPDDFWGYIAAALSFFIVAEFALLRRRSKKLDEAQEYLRLAKQEVLETAQLSLSNPYPLIHLAEDRVIFINPAAFREFPDIMEQGLKHPVLSGLAAASKETMTTREVVFGRKIFHQTIAPVQGNGQFSLVLYCYDITERKVYEARLRKSNQTAEEARREAERANQARGDFLANMSHELRTPMNAIVGLADILAECGLKPEHQKYVSSLSHAAHILLTLLNDILDFSKIEAGELALESIPYDPRRVIEGIEAMQKPVADHKGLALRTEIGGSVPHHLLGDPVRLQQILNNLIGNSLKFTEKGGITISIGGKADGTGSFIMQISVADTGIGIPKDKQAKVFEKFQQADSSTARKYGGTGLGLAICKNLAELMGGGIALESQEGKGTTFTVTIPARIAESELKDGEIADQISGVQFNGKARILLVDDHPVNLLVMQQALKKLGFQHCDEAESGRQAVEMVKAAGGYDLILMDCQMPDMDGYEASRQIRIGEGSGRKTPIIAITADAMKGAEEKCKAAGMDDYISKPVDKEKLRNALRRWVPFDGNSDGIRIMDESVEARPGFDWKHLYEISNGKPDIEKTLINMFLENLDMDLKKLQQGFVDHNFDEWEAAAHKIHGASSNIGACALADICAQAEVLSSTEEEKIKNLHQLIVAESLHLHSILEKNTEAA